MKFDAALTNPVPTGEVVSTGTVGPWATEPADLPLAGKYTFTRADLDTIKGIGGTLRSEGTYEGIIENLHVVGHTSTPDFNLDMGGKPVPLETSFNVRVEAQNGTTHLDEVEAHLFGTVIHAKGDVVNLPGPAGFDITLSATVAKGRIEDLLRLAVDSPRPLLEGTVGLSCRVLLPAGHVSVRERLQLTGQFDLDRTTMTNPAAELKIKELSQRGQGKSKDEGTDERVMTSLSGHFRLRRGVLSLPDLSFQVPGATIALDGTYALATGQLDFIGELRMQASMSRVVGGIKSIFLRPFDFFFRRDGAGTVVPIKITGSREHPEFGVRVGAALTRGK